MAKWVTYYWSILGGVQDLEVHPDRESATKDFQRRHRNYFELNTPFKAKLPCRYGFWHRGFFGETKRNYERQFGKIEEAR